LYFRIYRQILLTIKQKEVNMANKYNTQENGNNKNTHNRGFASMPHEKVQEIASKGGHASAEKAGHEGMAARGRAGGHASAEKAGHEGMAERGRKGGHASGHSKNRNEEEE
jgi:general stress protein YciG